MKKLHPYVAMCALGAGISFTAGAIMQSGELVAIAIIFAIGFAIKPAEL